MITIKITDEDIKRVLRGQMTSRIMHGDEKYALIVSIYREKINSLKKKVMAKVKM